ncbi:unnamed protein product [Cuscuta europaea]|uniref:Uncharacterized protein n=1 Tax=Cuscuta europaea TaxID=41803 RepID=A0A9P0YHX1_CUSEU|nr:unnamed protein product [Cuscuta europaea]
MDVATLVRSQTSTHASSFRRLQGQSSKVRHIFTYPDTSEEMELNSNEARQRRSAYASVRVARPDFSNLGLTILALMVTEMGVAPTVFYSGEILVVWVPVKEGEFGLQSTVGGSMRLF